MGGDVIVGANEGIEELTQKQTMKALVVEDVRVMKRVFVVDVPKYQTVDQIRYNTIDEDTTKYNKIEKDTTKFIPQEEFTTRYMRKDEDTIKYNLVEKDYEVERPVLKDKMYERPVIVTKEYTLATYKDVNALKALMDLVPKLVDTIQSLTMKLAGIIDYKLIEEERKVPRIKWIPREEPRIIWKDVPRERCKVCSKEV